jgi:large subunit ribosomal protein L23
VIKLLSDLSTIIRYPIITDKATRLLENNKYSFVVTPKSNKIEIKKSIEYLFDVKVKKSIQFIYQKNKNVLVNILDGNHIIKKQL